MNRASEENGARPPRLSDLIPGLLEELARGLAAENRLDLIPQLAELVVLSRCGCKQPDCATIYVEGGTSPLTDAQKRDRGVHWQSTIPIDGEEGHIALDTDRFDRITSIEILNRQDIRERLGAVKWRTT